MGFFGSNKCRRCHSGYCRCNRIAQADRAEADHKKQPRVCGAHLHNGGTCHRTVNHGETCTARH